MYYNRTADIPPHIQTQYPTTGDPLIDWVLFVGVCILAAWLISKLPD